MILPCRLSSLLEQAIALALYQNHDVRVADLEVGRIRGRYSPKAFAATHPFPGGEGEPLIKLQET